MTEVNGVDIRQEGERLILQFRLPDGRGFDVSLDIATAGVLLAGMLAQKPIQATVHEQAIPVQATVGLAVGPEMVPALLLGFGALRLAVPLPEPQLASLAADMSAHVQSMARKQ